MPFNKEFVGLIIAHDFRLLDSFVWGQQEDVIKKVCCENHGKVETPNVWYYNGIWNFFLGLLLKVVLRRFCFLFLFCFFDTLSWNYFINNQLLNISSHTFYLFCLVVSF